jgi:hypothetical protein
MVKINLANEIPEWPIWRQMEKICWVIIFSMPVLMLLWVKLFK